LGGFTYYAALSRYGLLDGKVKDDTIGSIGGNIFKQELPREFFRELVSHQFGQRPSVPTPRRAHTIKFN